MSSVAVFSKASPFDALQRWLPKLVLAPSMLIVLVGFYGYIFWTFLLSFTNSSFMPSYQWVGLQQYARLMANDRWWVASKNLAVFGGMFIVISLVIGVFLAILLDQRIRKEGFIRTIYLYPMALSMIVTGTAWNGCSTRGWAWTRCSVTGAGKVFALTGCWIRTGWCTAW
jgi:glucose/mannose transport system permease protein